MNAHAQRITAVSLLLVAVATAVVLAQLHGQLDLRALMDRLAQLPPWLLLLIVLGAPLLGVPLSGLLVVVGASFPLPAALASVVAVLAAHHLLIFPLSRTRHLLRVREALARRGLLPDADRPRGTGDAILFILVATWVPGLSYVFKVALTALAGIPFRSYFTVGVLSQTVAATPYLMLGQAAESANLAWVGALVFAIFALSWLLRRAAFKAPRPSPADERGEP